MKAIWQIRDALLTVSDRVWHHYAAKQEPPYIVWAEDSWSGSQFANGRKDLALITGTVDLFTRELDKEPLVDAVEDALDKVCAWRLNSTQYEEDTGLLHYEWEWTIPDGEMYQKGESY